MRLGKDDDDEEDDGDDDDDEDVCLLFSFGHRER